MGEKASVAVLLRNYTRHAVASICLEATWLPRASAETMHFDIGFLKYCDGRDYVVLSPLYGKGC